MERWAERSCMSDHTPTRVPALLLRVSVTFGFLNTYQNH